MEVGHGAGLVVGDDAAKRHIGRVGGDFGEKGVVDSRSGEDEEEGGADSCGGCVRASDTSGWLAVGWSVLVLGDWERWWVGLLHLEKDLGLGFALVEAMGDERSEHVFFDLLVGAESFGGFLLCDTVGRSKLITG